jgi:hypothetical protein
MNRLDSSLFICLLHTLQAISTHRFKLHIATVTDLHDQCRPAVGCRAVRHPAKGPSLAGCSNKHASM